MLTTDLRRWDPLALSWFGWCNVLKMNTMPLLLYLLLALPVKLPQTFFRFILYGSFKVFQVPLVWQTSTYWLGVAAKAKAEGRHWLPRPCSLLHSNAHDPSGWQVPSWGMETLGHTRAGDGPGPIGWSSLGGQAVISPLNHSPIHWALSRWKDFFVFPPWLISNLPCQTWPLPGEPWKGSYVHLNS